MPPASEGEPDLCGFRTLYDGTVFFMEIHRSFDPGARIKLCQRRTSGESFLLADIISDRSTRDDESRRIELDDATFQNIYRVYESALEYDVKDETTGLDGSKWCLETNRGSTYSKACFWSPEYKTKERRLEGLQVLGNELWRLADLEARIGALY